MLALECSTFVSFFQFLSRIGTKKDSTKFSWQIFPSSLSSFRLFFKGRRSSSKHETRTSHFVSPYSKLESCWSKSYTRLNLLLHHPSPLSFHVFVMKFHRVIKPLWQEIHGRGTVARGTSSTCRLRDRVRL